MIAYYTTGFDNLQGEVACASYPQSRPEKGRGKASNRLGIPEPFGEIPCETTDICLLKI